MKRARFLWHQLNTIQSERNLAHGSASTRTVAQAVAASSPAAAISRTTCSADRFSGSEQGEFERGARLVSRRRQHLRPIDLSWQYNLAAGEPGETGAAVVLVGVPASDGCLCLGGDRLRHVARRRRTPFVSRVPGRAGHLDALL